MIVCELWAFGWHCSWTYPKQCWNTQRIHLAADLRESFDIVGGEETDGVKFEFGGEGVPGTAGHVEGGLCEVSLRKTRDLEGRMRR